MHWRHKGSHLHNNDASLVSRSAHVLCWQCALALSLSVRGPGGPARRCGLQGLPPWLHAWRWRTWQCFVWPPTQLGALLWRHMHMVYNSILHTCKKRTVNRRGHLKRKGKESWPLRSQYNKLYKPDIILIIHVSECISGSATCIEDIYNDANRTRRLAVEFGLHNIVNVRNHVATPLMHEE